jgi:hypothetical protein
VRNFGVIFERNWLTSAYLRNEDMPVLTTIIIGTCVSVQGNFVARLANGLVSVRVGKSIYTGRPVGQVEAA